MAKQKKFKMSWEEAVSWLINHPEISMRDLARACYFDGTPLDAAARFADSLEWIASRDLLLSPPGKALDLGAGRGLASFALARDGWSVTAIEPDPSALVGRTAIVEMIRESGLAIEAIDARAEALPFADETFDVVYCRQALHHASNLKQMCREALRVLKKGGVFLATREHVISKNSDLNGFLDRHPLHFLYGGEYAYTLDEYKNALCSSNIRNIDIYSPMASMINLFPSTYEAERKRMARIAGVAPEDLPDYIFRLRDAYDQNPGRLYSFRVVK